MRTKLDFLTPELIKQHCRDSRLKYDPNVFPWKYLGWSDEDFMAVDMKFAHGGTVPKDHQRRLLGIVRAQEKLLKERYDFVTERRRALNTRKLQNLAPRGKQLEMF